MAASGEFFLYPMDGCLSGCDGIIDQRPYHRNCKCELHKNNKSRKHNCPNGGNQGNNKGSVVSYPMRRSWSEGCLALSSFSSPASSPGYVSPAAGGGEGNNGKMKMVKRQLRESASVDDDDLFPGVGLRN